MGDGRLARIAVQRDPIDLPNLARLTDSPDSTDAKDMTFDEYQSEASTTALYPRRMENLEYPTLGLTGEAGEVANIVKKIQRDHGGVITDEVRGKLKDELGDVLWYISACADELGLTLSEIAEFNVGKLAKRHGK